MPTLREIIEKLPAVLQRRFSEKFWVDRANKILIELERTCDIPDDKEIHGIKLQEKIFDYKIPDFMARVINCYTNSFVSFRDRRNENIPDIEIIPQIDKVYDQISFTIRQKWIELNRELILNSEADPIPIDAVTGKTDNRTFTAAEFGISDNLISGLLVFTTGANAGYSRQIASQDTDNEEVTVKRDFFFDIEIGDEFYVTNNFFLVQYKRRQERFLNSSCPVDFTEELGDVIHQGIWYWGEKQVDDEDPRVDGLWGDFQKAFTEYQGAQERYRFKPQASRGFAVNGQINGSSNASLGLIRLRF